VKSIRRHAIGIGVGCLLIGLIGCSSQRIQERGKLPIEKTRPLPEVAAGDTNFSSYKPANPYEELGPNVLGRTIFDAAVSVGYRVEIRDLRVDAKKKGEDIKLPGAAFLEVQGGSGILTMTGKRQELPPGSTFSIAQGQAFTLESTSDQPLAIRARVVRAE
jgi:hypothetical protein